MKMDKGGEIARNSKQNIRNRFIRAIGKLIKAGVTAAATAAAEQQQKQY